MFCCTDCSKSYNCVESFISHLKFNSKNCRSLSCGFTSCYKRFNNIYALQKHLYKNHKQEGIKSFEKNIDTLPEVIANQTVTVEYDEIPESTMPNTVLKSTGSSEMSNNNLVNDNLESIAAKFLSSLYSKPAVTRKIIQETVEGTHGLISDILDNLRKHIVPLLGQLNPEKSNAVKQLLTANPLNSFQTEYVRFKYLENLNTFIRPISVPIGTCLDDKISNDKRVLDYTTNEMVIIPLRKILKCFLKIPNVFQEILNYISTETNKQYISSLFNSKLWKKISINNKGRIILPLVLYYDDYETGNPLGTSAGVHKVGAFYVSLMGVPPKYASRLENIFLLGLCYSSDRIKYGNKNILKHFLEEFSFLEKNGITLELNSQIHQVYFCLFLVIGDNLGVNSLLGFNESFNSNYFCRVCTSSKLDAQNSLLENIHSLRSPENYAVDLNGCYHGIKEYCILNELDNFHVAENSCVDVMHDLFEGICRYDLGKILFHFIKKKKMFSLLQLHRRIKFFDHDTNVEIGNRIPLISIIQIEKCKIIMSSSEMYSFLIFLPFLIGDFVDFDDECWRIYLLLYEIIQIIMKTSISDQELTYLQHLIKEHHELYINCFNEPLKPKYHFLIHYPSIIKNIGPVHYFSSIRYESFHRIGKTSAHVICNRKNIIVSLATRYQLKLSNRLLNIVGLSDQVLLGTKCHNSKTYIHEISRYLEENFVSVNSITFNGTHYKTGNYIQINKDQYNDPIFAKICLIIANSDENILFYCFLAKNLGKDYNFMAYEIVHENEKKVLIRLPKWNFIPVKPHTVHGGRLLISAFNQD